MNNINFKSLAIEIATGNVKAAWFAYFNLSDDEIRKIGKIMQEEFLYSENIHACDDTLFYIFIDNVAEGHYGNLHLNGFIDLLVG